MRMRLSRINAKMQMEIQFMFWTKEILMHSRPPVIQIGLWSS